MSNPNVLRQFRQAGQTSFQQAFDGSTPMKWVVTLGKPLRGVWIDIVGQLATSAGSTDGVSATDQFLKMLGNLEVTLNNDDGDISIVPTGTPLFQYIRFNQALTKAMMTPAQINGMTPTQPVLVGGDSLLGVQGTAAATPENFGVRLFIPFQCIGAESAEQDFAMLVPTEKDNSLTIIITPNDLTSGASRAFTAYAPFPGSDRTYTITDMIGTGICYAKMFVDQVEMVAPGTGAGKWLPRYQRKQFAIAANAAAQTNQQTGLTNWERGGLWHAIGLFEQALIPATGPVINTAVLDFPAGTNNTNTQTLLRDFSIYADTVLLLQENIPGLVAQQHPLPDKVMYAAATGTTISDRLRPHTPIILNLSQGRSMYSLYDFTPFAKSLQQINFELDNIPAAGTAAEYDDFMVLRYQPR